jgi:hypothetical protein
MNFVRAPRQPGGVPAEESRHLGEGFPALRGRPLSEQSKEEIEARVVLLVAQQLRSGKSAREGLLGGLQDGPPAGQEQVAVLTGQAGDPVALVLEGFGPIQ